MGYTNYWYQSEDFTENEWDTLMAFYRGLKNTFNWYLNNINFFSNVSAKLYDKRLGLK